ncbi:MAG: DUF362 domain-containing protein [Bacillota bacterium]
MVNSDGKAVVALEQCLRYHPQTVRSSLEQLLGHFGGINSLVKPGQKVLLKPNLLAAALPVEAVSTHPVVMKAMAEMILEAGGRVYLGDSPGNDSQEKALRVCGMKEVIEETGAETLFFNDTTNVEVNNFKKRDIPVAAALKQVDLIFNMGKLKTHAYTGMTGGIKNVFGCVVGSRKARFHLDYPFPLDFSRLLVDVYLAVKPSFSILDAVIAMEGTGPRRGRPRQLGLLMASPSAVGLDRVAAAITGFYLEEVPTLVAAKELNLTGSELSSVLVKGLSLERSKVLDFDKGPAAGGRLSRLLAMFPVARIRDFFAARRPYPKVKPALCNGCGVCRDNCPAQVIEFKMSIPDIDYRGCIRCYCCQEFCAQGAIDLTNK